MSESVFHEERLKAAGLLFAGVAHELKNVLMALSGNAQIGQMARSLPEAFEVFRRIYADTKRGDEILMKVLRFSCEDDELEFLAVSELVASVGHILESHLRALQVDFQLPQETPDARVKGRLNQLQQVLMNLILNAADAARSGAAGHRVWLEVSTQSTRCEIAVRDSGPGVSGLEAHTIFEPFFTTKADGTGLGLALSKQIAQQHGGALQLTNPGEAGACFVLSLPVATEPK
jgi:signal transduction histidine kinase